MLVGQAAPPPPNNRLKAVGAREVLDTHAAARAAVGVRSVSSYSNVATQAIAMRNATVPPTITTCAFHG